MRLKVSQLLNYYIKFADEIRQSEATMKEVASAGSISESYGTEISKGVKLSKFVDVK